MKTQVIAAQARTPVYLLLSNCTSLKAIAFMLLFALSFVPQQAMAVCTCGYSDGALTQATITPDGSFSDWTNGSSLPLDDPDNNVCDGPANMLTDRDAPVQSTGRDITHFAFTFDGTDSASGLVSLFTERTGSSSNVQTFLYYADTSNDGKMQTNEPVIGVEWKGNTGDVTVYIGDYNEVTSGGDDMVDGSGFGDGYAMPGLPTGFAEIDNGTYGSGTQMEFNITWGDLGLTGISNIQFHISSTNASLNASSLPAQIDDNLGGCGGGGGSSQTASLTIVPDVALSDVQGATVTAAHTLTNTGSGTDSFELTTAVQGGSGFTPTITIYADNDSSGTLTAGDTVITNTGNVASGADFDFLVVYDIPTVNPTDPQDPSGTATVVVTGTSDFNNAATDTATDTITVELYPDFVVVKSISQIVSDPVNGVSANAKAIPGAVVEYQVIITNTGGGTSDNNTFRLTDALPANMDAVLTDIGAAGSGPVDMQPGGTDCLLTYTYSAAGSQQARLDDDSDDFGVSTDGADYTYNPTLDGNGVDSSVTHLQVTPTGSFAAATAGPTTPSCTFTFRMRIR